MTFFKGIVCAILDNKYTLDNAEGAIKNRQYVVIIYLH